jgi:transcriptional regulator with XRE-family HTH domain
MKERILEFLKAENKTSAQFAEDIGVQASGISHILSGRNKPSLDFILKMLEKYRFLSVEWLLFGKGTMYKEQIMPDLFNQPSADQILGDKEQGRKPSDVKSAQNAEKAEMYQINDPVTVEKIVWFYKNNSFREYYPKKE